MTSELNDDFLIRDEMNALTDVLNDHIRRTEKALKELGLGVSASVTVAECDGNSYSTLTFKKYKGSWRLIVEDFHPGEKKAFNTSLLLSCSRHKRIEYVRHIPSLIVKIEQVAITHVDDIKKSIDFIKQILEKITSTQA